MSILVLQSSWWGRESWLVCLICLPGVSWWLSGSSSRCYGVVCDLWLWYFLIIFTYYYSLINKPHHNPLKLQGHSSSSSSSSSPSSSSSSSSSDDGGPRYCNDGCDCKDCECCVNFRPLKGKRDVANQLLKSEAVGMCQKRGTLGSGKHVNYCSCIIYLHKEYRRSQLKLCYCYKLIYMILIKVRSPMKGHLSSWMYEDWKYRHKYKIKNKTMHLVHVSLVGVISF